MKTNIRYKIKTGDKVIYKNKKYIIILIHIEMGGNCMCVDMIKHSEESYPVKFVKTIVDEEIEKLIILTK